MSLVFGAFVSGDGTSTRNDIEIYLAFGFIEQKDCAVLGPRIAKRLRALLEAR
jgi:hypothetical protein